MFTLPFPDMTVPVSEIPLQQKVRLFVKREDLIHPEISGNKYWKLLYNVNRYLERQPLSPLLITFGGAFSNHVSAVSALGKQLDIPSLGMIRGEELAEKYLENPTLATASANGMVFRFLTRTEYREKEKLTEILTNDFPNALIIPEGGTNEMALRGIRHMLTGQTKEFDYLCSAVGTGGTLAGLSAYCEDSQKVIGFKAVTDSSLYERVSGLSGRANFELLEVHDAGYGKISDETVRFINAFKKKYAIQLEPVYTGKMMRKIFELIEDGYFPEGSKILAFHTGGLQGITGANMLLQKKGHNLIDTDD